MAALQYSPSPEAASHLKGAFGVAGSIFVLSFFVSFLLLTDIVQCLKDGEIERVDEK
jgi:hypothetical protein